MNRANLIRLGVVALIGLAAIWLVTATEWVDVEVQTPLKGEAARNRFYAAQALLRTLGATVVKRESTDTMPPPRATLLLTSNHGDFLPHSATRLRSWVEQGGKLVIPGTMLHHKAMDDWLPITENDKAVGSNPPTGTSAAPQRAPGVRSPGKPEQTCREMTEPDTATPRYLEGRSLRLCPVRSYTLSSRRPPSWSVNGRDGPELMRVSIGKGSVTTIAPRDIFDNTDLLRGDHALLMIAALQLRRGDEIWFVTQEARAPLLQWLWRQAWAALLLALLVLTLALWRKGVRFGPQLAPPDHARRSMAEQVIGTAQFLRHHGGTALQQAQLRALDETAVRQLHGYLALDATARAGRVAQATGLDAQALLQARTVAPRRNKKDLAATLSLLETARRRLREHHPPGPPRQPPNSSVL